MKLYKRIYTALALLLIAGVLGSCIGMNADITIRRNGSGFLVMEYRMSRELESLGKLDGNVRWPPIPTGKADFERTADRVPGLTLKSFSSKSGKKDIINRVKLEFDDTGALLGFLDSLGQGAALVRENGQNRLTLTFGNYGQGNEFPENLFSGNSLPSINGDLAELAAAACEGYALEMSFTLPGSAELFLTDRDGVKIENPAGWKTQSGTRAAFSAPIGDMLLSAEPARLEIRWAL
ncbi:hypothetical protein AGMMS49991_09440 [Spirochaetia bacterium]|nr:hypothetical protein AGMMS49991_09440 [Spirochaetia bacterium]